MGLTKVTRNLVSKTEAINICHFENTLVSTCSVVPSTPGVKPTCQLSPQWGEGAGNLEVCFCAEDHQGSDNFPKPQKSFNFLSYYWAGMILPSTGQNPGSSAANASTGLKNHSGQS